jgi:hypothetical protein
MVKKLKVLLAVIFMLGVVAGLPSNTRVVSAQVTFDVGVIPTNAACPNANQVVWIYMDDEDDGNTNSRQGWIGATSSGVNTKFFFCKVDGTKFRPLTTRTDTPEHHYAVLKLGSNCPNGSVEFSRYFDNEDDGNENNRYGPLWPNSSNSNTRLYFCLFRGGSTTMSTFPSFNFGYGVFATSSFVKGNSYGYVYTDDEDDSNENKYYADTAWVTDAKRIIGSGGNTRLNLAETFVVR